jgi:hypothetical protein
MSRHVRHLNLVDVALDLQGQIGPPPARRPPTTERTSPMPPPTHAPELMEMDLRHPTLGVLDMVQQRVRIDDEKVAEYQALYEDGRDLGPLILFRTVDDADPDSHEYYLADGFHRRAAALLAHRTTLPALVYDGTIRDAIFYATSCNLHGKPLTNEDKRKRVETLLRDSEWSQWSDSAIAKHCGVSQPFVGAVRKSLITVISDEAEQLQTSRTYTDKHGHTHTMDTRNIGQHAAAPLRATARPTFATCSVCGRGVSHPTVLAGLGPVCAEHANGTSRGGSTGSPTPAIFTEVQDAAAPDPDDTPAAGHRNRWGDVTEAPMHPPQRVYSGDAEWYMPAPVLALVREVLGPIDVDPASCAAAQAVVGATTFYTAEDDGLGHPWYGTVFCNPPYSMPLVARFCGKLLEELDAGHTTAAILLINSVTDTDWFHAIAPRAAALCFTDGRIAFQHATREGLRPCQGQALLYFGPHVERFDEVFAPLGLLMHVRRAKDRGPQLALADAPAPAPEQPPTTPGTIAEQIVAVLRGAPDGLLNVEIATAVGRPQKRTHQALQPLVQHGAVRKEGQRYIYVEKES